MSITLVTGLPGNGKTLWTIAHVKALAEKEGRSVFYARINGLTLPWTRIDPYEWFKCPPNSLIVIDECQKSENPEDPKSPSLFGVRQRGAAVPIWAAKLEDHRHGGVDIFLITQDPMLLDGHDRKLCQRHLHFMRTFGMARATIHEYTNGPRDQVAKSRTGSIRTEWRFPKQAYAWYKSAEVHTVKRSIPMRVWFLLFLPLLLIAMVATVYLWWGKKAAPASVPRPTGAQPVAGVTQTKGAGMSREVYLAQFAPRVDGLAYTAPVYDEVTKPTQAPYPAACVQSKTRCQCYTQQATRLDVPASLCEGIAQGGFFVAWNQPAQQAVPMQARAPDQQPSIGHTSLGGVRVAQATPQPPQDHQTSSEGGRSRGGRAAP